MAVKLDIEKIYDRVNCFESDEHLRFASAKECFIQEVTLSNGRTMYLYLTLSDESPDEKLERMGPSEGF